MKVQNEIFIARTFVQTEKAAYAALKGNTTRNAHFDKYITSEGFRRTSRINEDVAKYKGMWAADVWCIAKKVLQLIPK